MKRRNKWLMIGVATLILGTGTAFLAFGLRNDRDVSIAVAVGTAEVVREVRTETIEISGNIEPVNAADLAFPIAGYVEAVYVEEGEYIESGQMVAVLEDIQQRYDLAEVMVEIDAETISGTARNLDLLDLKKAMLETSLEDTRLTTHIGGYVSAVSVDTGDYVTAQQAGSEKDVVARVIDRSSMTALVEVDELDAPLLEAGQSATLVFDAYPDLEVAGYVSQVPVEARVTGQGIAVLDVEVTVDDVPDEILPSFTFSGEIRLTADEEILLVPASAVLTQGDRSMVIRAPEGVGEMDPADLAALVPAFLLTGEAPGSVPSGPRGGAAGAGGIAEDGSLGSSRPVPVSVEEWSAGMVRVVRGLSEGDVVLTIEPEAAESDVVRTEEEGGTSVMELLGLPTPGAGRVGGSSPPPG